MKKYSIKLFIILAILSCTHKNHDELIQEESQAQVNEIEIDFICSNPIIGDQHSELDSKVEGLYELENKYSQVESGSFDLSESDLIVGLKRLIASNNKVDKLNKYNLKENFNSSITQTNFSLIKGQKELSDNLYARAKIEEYVFTSERCAIIFFERINSYVSNERLWYELYKAPSSIHREENRLYFILSGGWYMKPFYKEIVNQLIKK